MAITRRRFLKTTGQAAAIAAVPAVLHAAKDPQASLPLVDTHQHLWDLDLFQPSACRLANLPSNRWDEPVDVNRILEFR